MNHRKITGNESVADVDSLLETKPKETDKKKKRGSWEGWGGGEERETRGKDTTGGESELITLVGSSTISTSVFRMSSCLHLRSVNHRFIKKHNWRSTSAQEKNQGTTNSEQTSCHVTFNQEQFYNNVLDFIIIILSQNVAITFCPHCKTNSFLR